MTIYHPNCGGISPCQDIALTKLHLFRSLMHNMQNRSMQNVLLFLVILLFPGSCNFKNQDKMPVRFQQEGQVARKLADAALFRFDSLVKYNHPETIKWQYDVAFLGQAIDKLGYLDYKYSKYLEDYLDYFIEDDGTVKKYKVTDYNLDNINPAKGLITIYKRTGEEKYRKALNLFIDQLKNQPTTPEGGYWHKKIYPDQMWLDGIYMYSPFLAQYAKEFNDPQWFDIISRQITLIYEKTRDEKTGLMYHAWDSSHKEKWCDPQTGKSRQFWGRSMGWYTMALVDVLDYYPENNPEREKIIRILNEICKSLEMVRDEDSGLWYQVLDKGGEKGNYLEASGSLMFIYVFAKGAHKGYLPAKYLELAEESFTSAEEEFIVTGADGYPVLKNTCGGCGLGGNPYRDGSYEYYINEKRVDNDPKGLAPFILAAIELKH
jgi:unsaturated rhamnogalacturonyl hydrolase